MISIVLITYNRPEYLKFALEGILNQTYADFELFVMDNGSDSSTAELLNTYKDKRIRLVRNNINSRLFHNKSFEYTNREYLLITHDDDIMKPNFLSRMLEEIVKGDYDLLGCSVELIDEKNKSKYEFINIGVNKYYYFDNEKPFREYLEGKYLSCPTVIFNSKFVESNNIKWNLDAGPAADTDLTTRCLQLGAKVVHLNESLFYYRHHGGQDSVINSISMQIELLTFWLNTNIFGNQDELNGIISKSSLYINQILNDPKQRLSLLLKALKLIIANMRQQPKWKLLLLAVKTSYLIIKTYLIRWVKYKLDKRKND